MCYNCISGLLACQSQSSLTCSWSKLANVLRYIEPWGGMKCSDRLIETPSVISVSCSQPGNQNRASPRSSLTDTGWSTCTIKKWKHYLLSDWVLIKRVRSTWVYCELSYSSLLIITDSLTLAVFILNYKYIMARIEFFMGFPKIKLEL